MKNTFGNSVTLTITGESHGPAVSAVIDGIGPGIPVNEKEISAMLLRRRPKNALDTPRREEDEFKILSGVFDDKTTGTPILITIPNSQQRSSDYSDTRWLARPSHADFSAFSKYYGFEDWRGGGHFSGRITAAVSAAGAIFLSALKNLDISLGSHVLRCAGVSDDTFGEDIKSDIERLSRTGFPVIDPKKEEKMNKAIAAAAKEHDSVGGITETAVTGLPAGVGEPFFDSIESMLSHAIFSIGGIKGIEFGAGFSSADMRGSDFNDAFFVSDGKIKTATNNNGGINGGISNGMPIIFRCAVKPTPSIAKPQKTVDMLSGENAELCIRGRHDPAIIRRICPVIDSITAAVLCDLLALRYGTDVFTKGVLK